MNYLAEDYRHIADLLERSVDMDAAPRLAALVSNNLNVILSALEKAPEIERLRAELDDLRADAAELHAAYDELMQERRR